MPERLAIRVTTAATCDAPNFIFRKRWRRSILPSDPSALRGIDLRQPLPPDGTYRSVASVRSSDDADHHVKAKLGSIEARSRPSARRAGRSEA